MKHFLFLLMSVVFLNMTLVLPAQSESPVAQEVNFSGADNLTLKGTLLLPAKSGKFPAVLLLPGSGPPDRDGNVLPYLRTDLLKQIAERLAKEGIASLRFDKRSAAPYAKVWPKDPQKLGTFFRYAAFIADVKGAYGFLGKYPNVDARRRAIVGHSEGGLFTLQVANDTCGKADAPAALVLLGTAGRTLDVVLRDQLNTQLPRQISDPKTVQDYLAYADKAILQIKADKTLPPNTPPGLVSLFNPTVTELLHAYFTVDPATLASSYPGPVLLLQGAADIQVSAEKDFPRLKDAFAGRKVGTLETALVPQTSHNLKALTPDDQLGFTGPIVPAALDKITGFLKTTLKP